MNKRSIAIIFLTLFFGAMLGTLVGHVLGLVLPEGVVRNFFLFDFIDFNLAGVLGNDTGVITLNLIMFSISFGLTLNFNVASVIGLATAYYFLRYFR